jgi:hypothetical protein
MPACFLIHHASPQPGLKLAGQSGGEHAAALKHALARNRATPEMHCGGQVRGQAVSSSWPVCCPPEGLEGTATLEAPQSHPQAIWKRRQKAEDRVQKAEPTKTRGMRKCQASHQGGGVVSPGRQMLTRTQATASSRAQRTSSSRRGSSAESGMVMTARGTVWCRVRRSRGPEARLFGAPSWVRMGRRDAGDG